MPGDHAITPGRIPVQSLELVLSLLPTPTPISAGTVGGRAGSGDDVGGFLSNAEMDVSPGERAELPKAALRSPGGLPWRGCQGAD